MYIAIEGNIGAGKSTLANALAKAINANIVLEEFDNHPTLEDFYDNKEVNHFEMEIWFLETRFNMLKKAMEKGGSLVSDFWFEKSMIFANINLKQEEKMKFAKLFYDYHQQLKHPDTIIYIDSDSDALKRSIDNRNRSIEKNIKADYLLEISTAYKKRLVGLKSSRIISYNMLDMRKQEIDVIVIEIMKTLGFI